jgi:broad specificity phosphatase PhoE
VHEVVLVRHASTSWADDGRHTSTTDIALNAQGRAQAFGLRRTLPPGPYAAILSSPRRRAMETAMLAGFAGDIAVDDDLAEWDYGDVEGLTTVQIRAVRPGWSLFTDGPPGGERLSEVVVRADRVISRLLESAGRSIVFSHGHFLRVLAPRWIGLEAAVAGAGLALSPAAVSLLGFEGETPVIRRWNDDGCWRRLSG